MLFYFIFKTRYLYYIDILMKGGSIFYIIYEVVLNIIINSPINKGGILLGPFDPLGRGQVDL